MPQGSSVVDGTFKAIPASSGGYQTIDATAVVQLTIPPRCNHALVHSVGGTVWRADGEDPTASVGMPLADGADHFFPLSNLDEVRFIGGELRVTYYE